MKSDLVATVKFCFTDQLICQLSELVDENELGVEKALGRAVPLILAGLLGQAARGVSAPAALLATVRESGAADALAHLPNALGPAWHEQGTNLLLDLLGTTYRETVNQIAEDAGVRPSASGTLLQVAATAVLGVLGKFATENELTPIELVHWLQSQQEAICAALLPAAATDALAAASLAAATLAAASEAAASEAATSFELALRRPAATPPRRVVAPVGLMVAEAAPAPEALAATARRWQWGLLLLVAVGLGYGFGRRDSDRTPLPSVWPSAVAATTTPPPPAATASAAPASIAAPADAAAPTDTAAAASATPAAPLATATAPVNTAPPVAPPALIKREIDELQSLKDEVQLLKERRATAVRTTAPPADSSTPGKASKPASATGNAPENGNSSTETRLYKFLANPAVRVDSVNRTRGWIDFDRVSFQPGQTTLTPESKAQLAAIARILQSFPDAVVKIGGYTDSTGLGPHDLQFSEARARAVMTALSEQGVRLHRLFAQGYGSKYAVAPNSTEANRVQNRRVSIRVLRK